jgi:hypothetical protein
MPNSQKALKRGSAEAQTLWCIAGALQNRPGSVLNAPGLKMEVERSRELMDDRNPPAQALVKKMTCIILAREKPTKNTQS